VSNLLYNQWLESIARRDQAMLFVVVSALATIGAWLALRDVLPTRRVFVYGALAFYYATLIVVGIWGG
jgi:hypothetical protein